MQKLKKQIRNYDSQEKRLVHLFRYGVINQDSILDELNQLKRGREADKLKLENLIDAKERVDNLEKTEIKLSAYCQKLKSALDFASYQDKRNILDMLAIRGTTTRDTINIDGIIPFETTPTQTSDKSSVFTHHWTNIGMTTWM